MAQPETGNKTKHALFMGIPLAMVLCACESIGSGPMSDAPRSVMTTTPVVQQTTPAAIVVDNENEKIPEAPPVKTYVYDTGYGTVWQQTQRAGDVVTAPSQAEYSGSYDDLGLAEDSSFAGETYSLIDPIHSEPAEARQAAVGAQSYNESYNSEQGVGYPEPVSTAAHNYSYGSGEDLYGLHLASYRLESNATKGWSLLETQYATVLAGLEPRLRMIDIPGKGAFYRLVAGPYSSRNAALEACKMIKMTGDYCIVTEFGGAPFSS